MNRGQHQPQLRLHTPLFLITAQMTRFCLLSNHKEDSSGQEQRLWLPQPMQLALQQLMPLLKLTKGN